jgi:hypothetical protein
MRPGEIVVSVLLGLLVNEFSDVSPWLADKIVRWSARYRYADDRSRGEIRAEEWAAVVVARPGKLFKLTTALGFAGSAVAAKAPRAAFQNTGSLLGKTPTRLCGAVLGGGVVAIWVLLFQKGVALPEAYSLPPAAAALLVGVLVRHRRIDWSSWRCYGTALATGLLPTSAVVIWSDTSAVRLGALSLVSAFVFLAGSRLRLQAPVVVGAVTLLVACVGLLAYILPTGLVTAILLAGGGGLLLALGAAYERRRRLRDPIARLKASGQAFPGPESRLANSPAAAGEALGTGETAYSTVAGSLAEDHIL